MAPIAHYHMGGIRVDTDMQTSVPHLFAAGEAVGGANGANRLSGNAITEAFTFGRRAGLRAAALAAKTAMPSMTQARSAAPAVRGPTINPAAEIARLQAVMNKHVGPLRTRAGLERALEHIAGARTGMRGAAGAARGPRSGMARSATTCATCASSPNASPRAALAREESRGAHQREDFPRRASAGRSTRGFASPPTECALKAKLKICRGVPGSAARFELTKCRSSPGRPCSTALRWIRVHRDPSLAIRFSCINANACKECMISVDGKTVYACTTRLTESEMTLEPLPNKTLIRDLVTEIAPPDERLASDR